MNHTILSLNLNKFKKHSAMRNEFVILSFADFIEKLNSDSHFKNKFYTVLLLKDTKGTIIIDNQEINLEPRKFFFINYNQVYYFKNHHSGIGDVMMFTKSFYNYVYTGNKMIKSDTALHHVPPFLIISEENIHDLSKIFEEIQHEYFSEKLMRKEIICMLLKIFMMKYIRNSTKKNSIDLTINHKKELVQNFIHLVNLHYKELKTTSKYAEKLNLTPNYLNAVVRNSLDITAGQVIKNRIILEAERLLLHTTLSITEISYELGFNDNSHFGKYFKSEKKLAPNTYRLLKNTE